jgi:hypothetical protein
MPRISTAARALARRLDRWTLDSFTPPRLRRTR